MARSPQCVDCKLAVWRTSSNGRLHPSGDGRCRWEYPKIHLPVSMYLLGGGNSPSGGFINRRDEWRQCKQFQKREASHD